MGVSAGVGVGVGVSVGLGVGVGACRLKREFVCVDGWADDSHVCCSVMQCVAVCCSVL